MEERTGVGCEDLYSRIYPTLTGSKILSQDIERNEKDRWGTNCP